MGGLGSTRWDWERTRETTDPLLWLDVRLLDRRGALTPGAWSTTAWTSRGEPSGNITHWADADALILDYKTKGPRDAEWQPVQERIPLARTQCHYGGSRPWFLCPGCGRRRAVLFSFGGYFRCRACHDLAYGSTRDDRLSRLNRRGEKVTAKLGAKREWVLNWILPPEKPKGMHWDTYDRLRAEWDAIGEAARATHHAEFLRLLERTDRVLGERGH